MKAPTLSAFHGRGDCVTCLRQRNLQVGRREFQQPL
jgi:hypothetical protein